MWYNTQYVIVTNYKAALKCRVVWGSVLCLKTTGKKLILLLKKFGVAAQRTIAAQHGDRQERFVHRLSTVKSDLKSQ